MEVVTMDTGGAQETRWLCAEIPTKTFNPVLGLSIRMLGDWSRRKTQGSRSGAVEAWGRGQKFAQLEAGQVKMLVSPCCPAAGGTGSRSSMLCSNVLNKTLSLIQVGSLNCLYCYTNLYYYTNCCWLLCLKGAGERARSCSSEGSWWPLTGEQDRMVNRQQCLMSCQATALDNRKKDESLTDTKLLIIIIIVMSKGQYKELPAPLAAELTREARNVSRNLEAAESSGVIAQHKCNELRIGYLSVIFFQRGVGVCREQFE